MEVFRNLTSGISTMTAWCVSIWAWTWMWAKRITVWAIWTLPGQCFPNGGKKILEGAQKIICGCLELASCQHLDQSVLKKFWRQIEATKVTLLCKYAHFSQTLHYAHNIGVTSFFFHHFVSNVSPLTWTCHLSIWKFQCIALSSGTLDTLKKMNCLSLSQALFREAGEVEGKQEGEGAGWVGEASPNSGGQ